MIAGSPSRVDIMSMCRTVPVSVLIDPEYGLKDACVGVGDAGVVRYPAEVIVQ